jgi:lipoprotein-anchoring transpeptidase ErfK/SrfK
VNGTRGAAAPVVLVALAVPASVAAVTSASPTPDSPPTHVQPGVAASRLASAHGPRSSARGVPGAAPATAAPRHPATFGARRSGRPPRRPAGRLVAWVRPGRTVVVRRRPGGRAVARMARTPFGSRVAFPVLARRGRWVGVPAAQVGNGRLGWVDSRSAGLRWRRTRKTILIDLVHRRLELRQGTHTLLAGRVGVGAPGTPTPTGRFAITDKLSGPRFSAAYGCCILALSGHQTRLPPGWRGGDRLAIHGTPDPGTIGAAASTGCLHAAERLLRALMRHVPLGTPVIIR